MHLWIMIFPYIIIYFCLSGEKHIRSISTILNWHYRYFQWYNGFMIQLISTYSLSIPIIIIIIIKTFKWHKTFENYQSWSRITITLTRSTSKAKCINISNFIRKQQLLARFTAPTSITCMEVWPVRRWAMCKMVEPKRKNLFLLLLF